MDNIFDFDSGYDAGSQLELDNYNNFGYEEVQPWQGGSVDAVTGEWSPGLNESNSGTNAESMAGWKYSNGKWTDPSGKTYNLNSPSLPAALKASGLAKYAGAAGLGALINSLMNQGGGGSSAKIPQLMASRQQYAVPLTGPRSTYKPTDEEIRNYVTRPGMTDAIVARGMNQFGIDPQRMAGITGLPLENVQARYQAAMGPNMLSRRPGSGGVTYFSPMQYSPIGSFTTTAPAAPAETPETIVAAGGGMMRGGGISDLGGYSDGGRLLRGPGDGVSDSIPATINNKQPARLADGEFVVPARIVSELGNGSTEAGARKLYAMMDRIQKSRRKAKNIAANTRADKHLPA
jgi:hypothetical protein